MLANVWMFIWPNQRRILAAMAAGETPDPASPRRALYASRTNFALSFPMLFFMAGSSHYPMDWAGILVGVVLAARRDHRADRAEVLGQPLLMRF